MAKSRYADTGLVRAADRAVVSCVLAEYRLKAIRGRIRAKLPATLDNRLMHNVAESATVYLSLIRNWLGESTLVPTEFLAWPTRYLFELTLVLRYALSSTERLEQYLWSLPHDHRHVLQAFEHFVSRESSRRIMRERINADIGFEATLPRTPKAFPRWREVAKAVRVEEEYDSLYRLLSKLTHPTAWRVLNTPNVFDSDVLRCLFMVRAGEYAASIYQTISRRTSIRVNAPRGFNARFKGASLFARERGIKGRST